MPERKVVFTDSARRALVRAQLEAELLDHRYIGTEHLMLGLLHEEMGMASGVLREFGLDLEGLRTIVSEHSPPGDRPRKESQLDLTPGAKSIIRKAIKGARRRGENLIGTEHLLLSLSDQRAGTATRLLSDLGIRPEDIKAELNRLMQTAGVADKPDTEESRLVFKERYQIEEVVGVGSLSTVYRARDLDYEDIRRLVAIKEMSPPASDPQVREGIIESFTREAQLLAGLKHPFIPRFYDFFTYERRFYLVMEYVEGRTLKAIVEESADFLPLDTVIHWGLQLCDVLSYLHHFDPVPIIFRDLKPSNVLIDTHNNVRLIDFNIAKVFEYGPVSARIGTEGYAAPEQYHGEASPKGDLYALGATLHHLLTRRDPQLESPFSFEDRPVHAINPAVPPEVDRMISGALAYEPESRYDSAESMKTALEAVLQRISTAPPRE